MGYRKVSNIDTLFKKVAHISNWRDMFRRQDGKVFYLDGTELTNAEWSILQGKIEASKSSTRVKRLRYNADSHNE